MYNRVAVDLRRLPTLRAPSAASPPRIKRENYLPAASIPFQLPSFLYSLNECRSTCRVLFLFLRGVQRPRIFEEEEERVDLGKARETRRQVCGGGGWKGDDSPNLSSPRIDFEAAIDEIAGLDPFQPRRAKGLPLDLCLDRATITIPIGDTYIPATTCGISTSPPRCSLDQVALDQPPGAFEGGGRVRPVDFAGIVVAACWRQRAARRAKVR